MKAIRKTATLAAILVATGESFAPVSLTGRALSENVSTHDTFKFKWQMHVKSDTNESDANERVNAIKSVSQRKYKPVTFAAVTAASLLSCLPGQSLFKPPAAQASAPIVLREKLAKDDPPMVQAMTQAKELKKKRSMEEFDELTQKLNDVEDAQGKKARDAYEKQYNADKAAKAAQKVIDLEKLKRDLLDEGKDPFTYLDAEREVFLFEHDVDLAKVPGTPHNEQLIKEFRSRGKNLPTYDNQIYIVKCQVADLKARGVDPLEHFAQQEVKDKTRAIYYKMKDTEAAKVAEQYKALMEEYGGRLTPANEGEVPFVSSGSGEKAAGLSAKEKRDAEKAAVKAQRAQDKADAKAKRLADKQALADAKYKAKADKAAAIKRNVVSEPIQVEELATEVDLVEEQALVVETKPVSKATKKKGIKLEVSTLTKKVTPKQAAIVVVGAGGAALGYRLYTDASVERRNDQYRSIMGAIDDYDDFDDDDDDDDDDY
ncbi:hypothetical protein ACHAWO_005165 [Cyclotella atomus]|uniref:Uncharacterized protein n=1 Tax=Cyclotella atomus TaxID=382360 RepID=A0ABD3NEJ7_9STRA